MSWDNVMNSKSVCLVYGHGSSFVDRDIEMLSRHYRVHSIEYGKDDWMQAIRKSDVVVSWFASKHTLLPFFYAGREKKRIVIVGGYDACDLQGYGLFSTWHGRMLARYVYYAADYILPVDGSLSEVICQYVDGVEDKIRVVPTGYDADVFHPDGGKEDIVLTVCGRINNTRWWRKGLEEFVEIARRFDDTRFVAAGKVCNDMKEKVDGINSVEFTGWIPEKELLDLYQRASVYLQLSNYEGLPNVVCEAMLCGCTPIGTKVCGVPTAIGDTGYYVNRDDIDGCVSTVKEALRNDVNLDARRRIKKMFPERRREKALVEVIE